MLPQSSILIVDDEPDMVSGLRRLLSLDRYHVESAGSLAEMMNRADWTGIFAVLLDRQLPDGCAEDVLPRLRDLAPQAAVIIITGYADLDSTVAALRNGASDYILKPVNPDALRASLARMLQLKQAEDRARDSERLAAVGHMAAVVAHESRNYLQRIQANVEILQEDLADNAEALDHVNRIQTASEGLHRLLEDVRDYAAPIQLDQQACRLQSIWQQAWEDLAPIRRGRDATLVERSVDVPPVLTDVRRLHQVFCNLMENTLAACSDPVVVEIDCHETQLHDAPAVCITFRDNGPGLDQEQRQRIFEAFYTTKSRGTGLGMAIVQRLIEAHRGQIVVSPPGEGGAEFLITVPTAELI